ncbi:MAG: hypothetical protein ACOCRX_08470, partial [Candidatus Woesearchaeota archaeon]
YKYGDNLGLIDNKYLFILDGLEADLIKTKDKLSPLVLFDEDQNIIGLIMPVRVKEELKEDLRAVAS